MPITISQAYIETFERNVRQLAQQSVTRVRPYVTEKATNGEKHNWDRLAASDAALKSSARVPTPVGGSGTGTDGVVWSRRVSTAGTYHWGEVFEQEDPVQMLIDPQSSLTQNGAMAMRRSVDDVIIAAATGDSADGDGSPVTFPVGQRIDNSTAQITLDNVLAVDEKFLQNDIEQGEMKCAVIGPAQKRRLMQLMEVTSGDFQERKALASGYLPNWMGFDWVVSTRLLAPSAGVTSCLFMSKKAIGLQVNRDITARIAERPDLSFAWQVYAHFTMGATRVEDEHIVELQVKDTA